MRKLDQSSGPLAMPPVEVLEAARVADRIHTHARTIVEGEGAEEFSLALVEAVARAITAETKDDSIDRIVSEAFQQAPEGTSICAMRQARAALSTIRKHQAGE